MQANGRATGPEKCHEIKLTDARQRAPAVAFETVRATEKSGKEIQESWSATLHPCAKRQYQPEFRDKNYRYIRTGETAADEKTGHQ